MDQDQIKKDAEQALKESNVKMAFDIYYTADGIRPVEIPEDADQRIAAMLAKRLPPMISAAELGYPGRWRLIMRVVAGETHQRIEA